MMRRRTASTRAGFFLSQLQPGMRVLDVGCGQGTITAGLAEAVAPDGAVVGVDVQPKQVAAARQASEKQPHAPTRLSFQVGSVYSLGFSDGTFDAAFAHGLFEHLAEPKKALRELRRVLAAGGRLGLCSSDWSGAVVQPRRSDVDIALSCYLALRRWAGGDPFAGGRLAKLVSDDGGFTDLAASEQAQADLSYHELAEYVGKRIRLAAGLTSGPEQMALAGAARAATRWAGSGDGCFRQRWVAVTARKAA
jgi:SAM-dependent methyltransferase